MFTGWIYDHLLPHAAQVKVAHPVMLRAIALAKKKNDRIDAGKIADCLRCDFLPEYHMASTEIRDRRRVLRDWHLLVRQMVQMKNRISGLLMETGVSYEKKRLYTQRYFEEVVWNHPEVSAHIRPLLRVSRESILQCRKTEYALRKSLQRDPLLAERLQRLKTVPRGGHHGAELGAGDRRCVALPVREASDQLLRAVWGGKELCRQGDADTAFQAAQQASTAGAGGGGESGTP